MKKIVVFGLQGLIRKELPSKVYVVLSKYFKISDLIRCDCWCTNEFYNFSKLQHKLPKLPVLGCMSSKFIATW